MIASNCTRRDTYSCIHPWYDPTTPASHGNKNFIVIPVGSAILYVGILLYGK
ncbi:MAG: hypothetical protein ACTSVI_13740 [Promethearchaeota archaeon]